MSNKLLPCPCCGSNKVKIVGDTPYHWVFCKECDLESGQSVTIEGAAKKWNTRKPMERIVEKLEFEFEKHRQATKEYLSTDDDSVGLRYLGKANAFSKAIEIVKEELN